MRRALFTLIALLLAAAPVAREASAQAPQSLSDSAFVALVAKLSEPPGYFDTDNLISNEDSYLHVVSSLKRAGVSGGAYIGVGPDQSFSYIAATHPHIAFILDIRRDNLLQHLLFKAIFTLSRNRLEYMCLLFGRNPPADTAGWGARDIAALLSYIDSSHTDAALATRTRTRVSNRAKRFGLALSAADLATIARFHSAFIEQGPGLRFNSFGRAPQAYYPDLRQLLTEKDRTGRQSSYLAHEADFQFLKSLEERNLVVPVVGDLGGDKALAAIAQWLKAEHEVLSVFYTSNVEQYLFRDGAIDRFVLNVAALPRTATSALVRSYFMGAHPQNVPGYHSTQSAQFIDRFLALYHAGPLSYYALVTRDLIDP